MLTWREFFGSSELLTLAQAEVQYPNAKRHVVGGAFICHAGSDAPKLDEQLSGPLRERYGTYAVFQYSSRSPNKEAYKQIVRLALEHCRCAVVACSAAARNHPWVYPEVDWLLDHDRRILVFRLDSTGLEAVHPGLADITRVPHADVFLERDVNELFQRLDQLGLDGYPTLS